MTKSLRTKCAGTAGYFGDSDCWLAAWLSG